jgi:superfamily I DNA/RNA helicase
MDPLGVVPVLRLEELNAPQREAVTTIEGPLLVLAGAGSGKTRVITYRIAHLLERGVDPGQILAVSFTNKAADEMVGRVEKLVGARGRALNLSTFHSLGLMILKAERAALGYGSGFTIYDGADQLGVVREVLRRVHVDDRRFDAKAILFRISRAKNAFLDPDAYAASIGDQEYDLIAAEVYPKYQELLRGYHALDFDDLITATVQLLERDKAVRTRWAQRFRFVMVDEYQDTNRAQFHLLNHLVGQHRNVCVVGDDDQSIYGWRGAESGHILEFERHFPGAKVVRLEENYRSTPPILDAANAVIAHNPKRHKKVLWTARRTGEKLKLIVTDDAEAEAKFVAEEIEVLRATRGYRASDFAVLYRSNIQVRPLEEALRTQRLAYRVVGGQSFFERKEVKDAIAYLKLAVHPRDEIALRRIINYPARGIGAGTLEKLAEHAKARGITLFDACKQARALSLFDHNTFRTATNAGAVDDLGGKARSAVTAFCDLVERGRALLFADPGDAPPASATDADAKPRGLRAAAERFLADAGVPDDLQAAAASPLQAEKRLANLTGFLDALGRHEERAGGTHDLGAYLHALTLRSRDEDGDHGGEPDEVTLVTLHGAKGLEFPVVFLVGMEEELLPHRRTLYPNGPDVAEALPPDLGEERRLLYVGITRARELLYLTRARARAGRSAQKPRTPSRFLDEIPPELYEVRDAALPQLSSAAEEEAFARASLAKLFKLTD